MNNNENKINNFVEWDNAFLNRILTNNGVSILGIDFGHGETTVSKLEYDSAHGGMNVIPLKILAENNSTKIPTYLFYENATQNFYIGDAAFEKENNEIPGTFINFFKKMPGLASAYYPKTKFTYKQLMHIFVRKVLEAVFSEENKVNNKLNNGDSYVLLFGRPAGEKWDNEEAEYKKILVGNPGKAEYVPDLNIDGVKIEAVYMLSESFSSVSAAINLNAEINAGEDVVCIDLGSSTTDVSVIRCGRPIYDRGISLGGHHFDNIIVDLMLAENNKVRSFLYNEHLALAQARKAKENYYMNGGLPKLMLEFNDGSTVIKKLNADFMDKVCKMAPVSFYDKNHETGKDGYSSWADACTAFFNSVCDDFIQYGINPGKVVLTGGVSNMPLIKEIAGQTFGERYPAVDIIASKEPSYSVSNGLAYLALYQVKAVLATRLVKQQLPEIVANCTDINGLSSSLAADIMPVFVEQVCESLGYWRDNGDSTTLNTVMIWVANALKAKIADRYFVLKGIIDKWAKEGSSVDRKAISNSINAILKQNLNISIPVLQVKIPDVAGRNIADGLRKIDIDMRDNTSLRCYLSPWGFGLIIDLDTLYSREGGLFNNRNSIYSRAVERKNNYKNDSNFTQSIVKQINESETVKALISTLSDIIYECVSESVETLAIYSCRTRK